MFCCLSSLKLTLCILESDILLEIIIGYKEPNKKRDEKEEYSEYILGRSTVFGSLIDIASNYRVRNSTENDRVSLLPATLEIG